MDESRVVLNCLSFVLSEDSASRHNALLCLKAEAFLQPRLIFARLDELECILTGLCASPTPLWGTVNSLFDIVATALLNNTDNHDSATAVQLIGMSQLITEIFFSGPRSIQPDLFPFAAGLISAFNSDFFLVDLSVILAIADHCVVGYLPHSSLVSILMERFVFVLPIIIKNLAICGSPRLAAPLGCPGQEDFFLTVWAALLEHIAENPLALRAIAKQFQPLLALADRPGHRQRAANLLLRFLAAHPQERQKLAAEGREIVDAAIHGTTQRQPAKRLSFEPKKQQSAICRASVEVLLKKKRWAPRTLVLIEEVGLVAWSAAENIMEDGMALEFADITHVQVTEQGMREGDRENVLRIASKRGEFFLAFQNHADALDWAAMLRQSSGVVP
jgi:hypothetical protein